LFLFLLYFVVVSITLASASHYLRCATHSSSAGWRNETHRGTFLFV
jgi:hypothetical protein